MLLKIKNNKPDGIFSQDFISDNFKNVINGELVSEWVFTNIFPNGNYIKPFWNGSEWTEGATPEEIAEASKPKVQNLNLQRYKELLSTDWYFTRFLETGQEVPLEIKQQRQEIRDKYNNLIQEINNE